tara:strand:+ start:473 stop:1012 length:540 start_codon:yes stop_codon:yes gene_type:complete
MNVLLLVLLLGACESPAPVLSGIPEDPLLAAPDRVSEAAEPLPTPYTKPPEVWVDIRYLCGQPLTAVRADLLDQLGPQLRVRELDAVRGREIQYERGRVRVLNGVVYMMSIPLNEPMYRRVAFERTGFPAFSGSAIQLSGEYRMNNEWDFRRIRMTRVERDSEFVNHVEAWRWLPRERQ